MLHFIFFSTTISTEYFKHAAHSPFFSSKCRLFHNATFFSVSVLFTFYIQGVLKFKCKTLDAKRLCCNKFKDGLVSCVLALSQFCMSVLFASLCHVTDIILAFPTQTFPFSRFRMSKHFVPQSSFIEHQVCPCLSHWPECLLIFSPLSKEWIV